MTAVTSHFFHITPTSLARRRLEEAEHYFLAGNLNEALAAAQQAWREYPKDADVFRVLAYIHLARGEYPPAAQAAYQSVVLDGQNPASYAMLAQVYVTFNMLQLAEETLAAAGQSFPEDSMLLALAADVRFRQRGDAAAEEFVHRALAANPENAYAKALLGAFALRKKRYDQAVRLLAETVVVYPQRWDYLRDYGIALLHVGRTADARQALLQSFHLNPTDPLIQQHLYQAIRLTNGPVWYWRIVQLFYDKPVLGWSLITFGAISVVVGIVRLVMLLMNAASEFTGIFSGMLLFLGGMAMIMLAQGGTLLRNARGRRFEARLRRMLGE